MFAIPSYGLLFKCRAAGDLIDLEYAAFFALLRFVKTSLAKEKITALQVLSSNPAFVFSLTNGGIRLTGRPQRRKMLAEYQSVFNLTISYIAKLDNKTIIPPTEYPSTPADQSPVIDPGSGKQARLGFKPIQKGIDL
jgi:hypothetical protein